MGYAMSPVGDEVTKTLMSQGFRLPEAPDVEDQPALPDDLSDLDDVALMNEFSLFTAWADYANAQVGLATIAEREAERELDYKTGLFWSDQPRTKPVTTIKAEAAQEPQVRAAQETLDKATAYRRMVSEIADRYERDAMVLSRELTRRTQGEWNAKISRRERWAQ
jgi:hypothetical protein